MRGCRVQSGSKACRYSATFGGRQRNFAVQEPEADALEAKKNPQKNPTNKKAVVAVLLWVYGCFSFAVFKDFSDMDDMNECLGFGLFILSKRIQKGGKEKEKQNKKAPGTLSATLAQARSSLAFLSKDMQTMILLNVATNFQRLINDLFFCKILF